MDENKAFKPDIRAWTTAIIASVGIGGSGGSVTCYYMVKENSKMIDSVSSNQDVFNERLYEITRKFEEKNFKLNEKFHKRNLNLREKIFNEISDMNTRLARIEGSIESSVKQD